eukprot:Nitzschia sp. Nitz4//scaffold26_size159584//1781//2503//NITZ4_002460-RA/size159584-processed-gene-0.215-mRNA-1//-1//CDS//3329544989//9245//frame0
MSCPSESLLSNAIHLNNEASRIIDEASQYEEAISMLSASLVQLKQAIRQGCLPAKEVFLPSGAEQLRFLGNTSCECVTKSRSENDWYLYEHPIQICANATIGTPQQVEVVTYAVIFNLGLCHHVQAFAASNAGSRYELLQRAASFYSHAQRLTASNTAVFQVDLNHALVVANNLGHCHHFLNDEGLSKQCFQRLLNVIMFIQESGSEGREILSRDEDRLDGFMVNIMHHLAGANNCAPAA